MKHKKIILAILIPILFGFYYMQKPIKPIQGEHIVFSEILETNNNNKINIFLEKKKEDPVRFVLGYRTKLRRGVMDSFFEDGSYPYIKDIFTFKFQDEEYLAVSLAWDISLNLEDIDGTFHEIYIYDTNFILNKDLSEQIENGFSGYNNGYEYDYIFLNRDSVINHFKNQNS